MLTAAIAVLIFLIGLTGAVMISAGAWLFSPAAGLITGGIFCIFCSCIWAKSLGKPADKGGN
ncbi:hypothetical protein [Citrobacter europaeus]|uniref:hypothetical protein n=1 Tax=Citrobacter europaeus TaxID=1914243 RepID=UPI001BD1533F|nr:hypothetical protein [Citrobacter europaeus]